LAFQNLKQKVYDNLITWISDVTLIRSRANDTYGLIGATNEARINYNKGK